MRIQDLTPADFPDIDAAKFEEWKALTLRAMKVPFIGLAIMIGGYLIAVPLIGGAIGWLIPVIAYFVYMIPQAKQGRRVRELNRELGMKERLRAKRQAEKLSAA
jgi:hypothetical protein